MIAALLGPGFAFAAGVCGSPSAIPLEKRVLVPNDVNFFLRSSPATGEVGLATARGNRLFDAKAETFREVPGQIDPVLSPDGALLTTPETWVYNPKTKKLLTPDQAAKLGLPGHEALGVRFSLQGGLATEWIDPKKGKARATDFTEEQLQKMGVAYAAQYMSFYRFVGGEWKLLAQDKDSQVVYQSVGVLGRSKDGTVYRLLVEGDGGLYTRDYELNTAGTELRFGQPAHAVCGGYHGTLPVIDKAGLEFTSFDPEARATKLIRIGVKGDQCEVRETFPVLLGKTDFSPDRGRLVFHLPQIDGSAVPAVPGRRDRLGVFLFDRAARALVPVPGRTNEDSYFPVFLDDSRIAYLSATRPNAKGKQKFFINVASLADLPLARCRDCYDGATRTGQLAALLGLVQLRRCAKGATPGFLEAMASFGTLSRDSCPKLAAACGPSCLRGALAAARTPAPAAVSGKKKRPHWDGGREHEDWNLTLLEGVAPADLAALCGQVWKGR